MRLNDKEHYDLMAAFERTRKHQRLDKENKNIWKDGWIYQDGEVNSEFKAFREGYALAKFLCQ